MLMLIFSVIVSAEQLNYNWTVSFSQSSLLLGGKKIIMINDQFPGPLLNTTTDDVININIYNNLTEPFLITWNGIRMMRNSWQDGVQETNCPIMPATNWTYTFQMKDQVGSYFYFPSLMLQKAAGGYGPIRVNNRNFVPLPFPQPDYQYDILIGDWYNADYQEMRVSLDGGRSLPIPDGVLINGLGTNQATFDFEPGATHLLRISNVGLKTTLNFKIQNHTLLLVETEGSYTLKQYYRNLDIHVGQSYSVIVTAMNQIDDASSFYMVVASRFIPHDLVGIGLIRYSGFQGQPLNPIPPLVSPYDFKYSMDQALSIRLDLSVGAARRTPQGSYHYRSINVTRRLILRNNVAFIDGKYRYTVNGVSFVHPYTPLKLADYYNVSNSLKAGIITDEPSSRPPRMGVSVIDTKYHDFVHIVFQNPLVSTQTWHSDGYNFFVVGMGNGIWNERDMDMYNMIDAIYRSTVQVYPMGWTAILITLDNQGMWNLRSQDAEKCYLGQELYLRVKGIQSNPRKISPRDEAPIPANVLRSCGV